MNLKIIKKLAIAILLIILILVLTLCMFMSNEKAYKKISEYQIVDSNRISYNISYYQNYRDDHCFTIDESTEIYFDDKPNQVVKLISDDNNILYWIYFDETFEMLLYTNETGYAVFDFTEQGEHDPIKISEDCLTLLKKLIDQKIMDQYIEIKSKKYWYERISIVMNDNEIELENYISTENKEYLILDDKTLWITWGTLI